MRLGGALTERYLCNHQGVSLTLGRGLCVKLWQVQCANKL